jgi:hypothetical protein
MKQDQILNMRISQSTLDSIEKARVKFNEFHLAELTTSEMIRILIGMGITSLNEKIPSPKTTISIINSNLIKEEDTK